MARKKRFRPVVPDRLDLRDRPYMPSVTTAPPLNLMCLSAMKPQLPILDQDQTSACTGFAMATVVNYLMRRAKRKSPAVSPFMLYSMARRYDEIPGTKSDTGSSLRGVMKGWYKHGACAENLWTGFEMPPPVDDPKKDWWPDAVRRPLGAYYRVDSRSITDMHVALCESGILLASAICHKGWDEGYDLTAAKRRNWEIPYFKASPNDMGHAFAIVGYNQSGFLIQNSWGEGWGDGGIATLTYEDWSEHAMDCWVAQLGVVTDLHLELAGAVTLRTTRNNKVAIAGDTVLRNREISPFIVNMENNGRLSQRGEFRTNESDLKALLDTHLKEARSRWNLANRPIDVAIYAHGGLTGEGGAAETAARWIPALYEAKIFPIFFMWETDLWSTIKNRLSDLIQGEPRPTGGVGDIFLKFWNRRLERLLSTPGSVLWGEMKQNAEAISRKEDSGAMILNNLNEDLQALTPDNVRLHLIGHSAGAIVHCYMADRLINQGWKFATVNFMAPAARMDLFETTVLPRLGKGIDRYHQFHLSEDMEERDPTCRPILGYGRSLLYLVSESFEGRKRSDILGIERQFEEHVPKSNRIKAFSPMTGATESSTHGGFDNDPATMRSVIDLIREGKVNA